MNYDLVFESDFLRAISPEFIVSLMVMLIICTFSIVVYFKQKKYGPLDKPKGIVSIAEFIVDFGDRQISQIMGCPKYFSNFAAYIIPLALYIALGFFIGLMGIPNLISFGSQAYSGTGVGYVMSDSGLFVALPNPFTNLTFTLLIGLITVVMIEITKIRTQRWSYYKQFIFTFPPLLPILTNFVPMISLGMRLFGNAFAGFCIMTLLYSTLGNLGNGLGLIAAPVVMPILHAYFDIFSGFIQTLVFVMLTMMYIAQEAPKEEAAEAVAKAVTLKASI